MSRNLALIVTVGTIALRDRIGFFGFVNGEHGHTSDIISLRVSADIASKILRRAAERDALTSAAGFFW